MSTHNSTTYAVQEFIPPLPNKGLIRLIYWMLPLLYWMQCRFSVRIDEESRQALEALKGERWLLLPNHPFHLDALVMMELSKRLERPFYFLVAREVFDMAQGLFGLFLQHLGCYSVVRGSIDKESFKTTRDILAHNKGPLVIFVEGRISHRNDMLLPLEPGVIHLAFSALQELYKEVGEDMERMPSLYLLPVAIKYFYQEKGLLRAIDKSVRGLELAVGIPVESQCPIHERLRRICSTVFEETAKQYQVPFDGNGAFSEQVATLEDKMLDRLEHVVNLEPEHGVESLNRVRRVRNTANKLMHEMSDEHSYYQMRLHDHQKAVLKTIYRDLDEVINLNTIYESALCGAMTPERSVELINMLEREVFGQSRFCHPRTAMLKAMAPIDLKPHFLAFKQSKKTVETDLTHAIEDALGEGIRSVQPPSPAFCCTGEG